MKMLEDLAEDFPLTQYGAKFVSIAKGWAENKLHVYQVASQSEQIIRDVIRNFIHHATITDMAKWLEAADALLSECFGFLREERIDWIDAKEGSLCDRIDVHLRANQAIDAAMQESGE